MKPLNIIIVIAFLVTAFADAQQDPNYTFYRYNMNIYNPAFAGSSEGAELALGLRSQWVGVDEAPESQSAIFGMPIGRKVGLGVSILNDQTFVENQTWLAIDFSYNIRLTDDHLLYFGLKGSANSYSANTQGLITYGAGQDGTLLDYESSFTPNIGAGVYLKHDTYFLSISVPKILNPDRLQENNGEVYLGEDRAHVYLSGGYDFKLGKSTTLHAMSMLRYVNASPLSVDITGIVDFGYRFNLGASYRHDESIAGLFLFKVGSGVSLGYAYEAATNSSLNSIANSTHELFMRLSM